jgi:hypothetical protein
VTQAAAALVLAGSKSISADMGAKRRGTGPAEVPKLAQTVVPETKPNGAAVELTPEARAELHYRFDRADADHSGYLDRTEFAAMVAADDRRNGVRSNDAAVDVLFDQLDVDGSGELTFDE